MNYKGCYRVCRTFHFSLEEKPSLWHRFWVRFFLGWKWENYK